MSDQTYNGWTNYETWLVKLWMDNSEGDQKYWTSETAEVIAAREEFPISRLAERIKDWLDEIRDFHSDSIGESGLIADLLGAAIGAVDTVEIARHLLDDFEDEDEDE